jgi:hypothetical protein
LFPETAPTIVEYNDSVLAQTRIRVANELWGGTSNVTDLQREEELSGTKSVATKCLGGMDSPMLAYSYSALCWIYKDETLVDDETFAFAKDYSIFNDEKLVDISSFPMAHFPGPIDQGIGTANFRGMLIYGTELYQVTNIEKLTTLDRFGKPEWKVTLQQLPLTPAPILVPPR